jgi:hypothetical protein
VSQRDRCSVLDCPPSGNATPSSPLGPSTPPALRSQDLLGDDASYKAHIHHGSEDIPVYLLVRSDEESQVLKSEYLAEHGTDLSSSPGEQDP